MYLLPPTTDVGTIIDYKLIGKCVFTLELKVKTLMGFNTIYHKSLLKRHNRKDYKVITVMMNKDDANKFGINLIGQKWQE